MVDKGIHIDQCSAYDSIYANMLINIYKRNDFETHRFLDIGCSCGALVKAIKQYSYFDSVVGIDNSEYLINRGRKSLSLDPSELKFANAEYLPFGDNSVTFLHCKFILEYMRDKRLGHVLKELYRVLVPNGLLFISLIALREGLVRSDIQEEVPKIIQTHRWWGEVLTGIGFERDFNAFMDYSNNKTKAKNNKSFYELYQNKWAVFTLTKREH
jgi:ubiquinone/menaquinone biosynthesis C-methylase UbiE